MRIKILSSIFPSIKDQTKWIDGWVCVVLRCWHPHYKNSRQFVFGLLYCSCGRWVLQLWLCMHCTILPHVQVHKALSTAALSQESKHEKQDKQEIFTSELYSWFKKTQQCRHIPKGPPQPPEERYPQNSNCLSASCVVHWEIKWCGLCLFESLFSLSRFVFFQLSKNNY